MLEVIVFVVDSALQLLMWLREQCRDIPDPRLPTATAHVAHSVTYKCALRGSNRATTTPVRYHTTDDGARERTRMPRGTRPTPEQKAAREQLTEARRSTLERKKRTRRLIQMGGVLAAYGFETPEQAEAVMRDLVGDECHKLTLEAHGVKPTERWPEEG